MYLNEFFNYDHISQQAQKEHSNQQIKQVFDSARKLKEFLDSTENIEPPYQDIANKEFCTIILEYIKRHSKQAK